MNNKIKIALAVMAGGSLILLNQLRKKRRSKTFTAPDGNSYKQNQIYRTAEGELYKNGKPLHFSTLQSEQDNHQHINYDKKINANPKNYDVSNIKNVEYHQRGVRHH